MKNSTKIPNRLINEKSPYLLQHAYNPVDWYPWCDEAFAKAKQENKPIFLSIGYSTCHWCHVMEEESFENEEVANYLNKNYVSIKVDREERPDIDSIYMSVCQVLTGSGGWPLSIFLDDNKKPFFAGTYFPREDRYGMAGFISILSELHHLWNRDKGRITQAADEIIRAISIQENAGSKLEKEIVEKAAHQLMNQFDQNYGGFSKAPKFPSPHNLMLLLRYYHSTNQEAVLSMIVKTLDGMMCGGIYDHIGYGFSRYSTDEKWLVPHFEKMLYDNALLAICFTEAYQVTKYERYKKVVEEILTYVLRDMMSKEGGFFTAEDADSEGVEGKFYVWEKSEILKLLGKEKGQKFCQFYDISEQGNFEGKNIPNRIRSGIEEDGSNSFQSCIEILHKEREKRIHPSKDTKILTSWNGLMIAALSIAGKVLKKDSYLLEAKNAVKFITNKLMPNGRLKARFCDGEVGLEAFAEDFSFLTWGLIELYEATYQEDYLKIAIELTEQFIKEFWDEKGGFFLYGIQGEQLIIRPKEIYDGAMPSANSVAIYNFIRLARLTGCQEYEEKANQTLSFFAEQIGQVKVAHAFSILSVWYLENKPKDIVLVSNREENAENMIALIRENFLPNTSSLLVTKAHENITNLAKFTKDYPMKEEKCTAYLCENYACRPPITEINELRFNLNLK